VVLPTISLLMNVSEMKMVRHLVNCVILDQPSLGHFTWGGRNFSHDARNITLTRGPDRTPVLHSDLRNSSGDFVPSEIDLATHIANIDGKLVYLY
jgi:hypothetical protein